MAMNENQKKKKGNILPVIPIEIHLQILQHLRNDGMSLYPLLFLSNSYTPTVLAILYQCVDITITTLSKLLECVADNQNEKLLLMVKGLILRDEESVANLQEFQYYESIMSLFNKCKNCSSLKFIAGEDAESVALDLLFTYTYPLLQQLKVLEIQSKTIQLDVALMGNFIKEIENLTKLTVIADKCFADDELTSHHYDHINSLTFVSDFNHVPNLDFLESFNNLKELEIDNYICFSGGDIDDAEDMDFVAPLSVVQGSRLEKLRIGIPELWHNVHLKEMEADFSGILESLAPLSELKQLSVSHPILDGRICNLVANDLIQLERIIFNKSARFIYSDELPAMIESLEGRGKKLSIEFEEFHPGHRGAIQHEDLVIIHQQTLAAISEVPNIVEMIGNWKKPNWSRNLSYKKVRAYQHDQCDQLKFLPCYLFDALETERLFLEEERFCLESWN